MREITETKEIQSILLNILKYVDKVCKENNINYSLAGGTLLGAVRHKGFIPWDDDIDIMMLRPDYERFLEIMDKDHNNQFKCLHYGENFPNYFYRFAKVVDLTTAVQEGEYITNEDMGLYVDIFPFDGLDIKKSKKSINKALFYSRMINISATKKFVREKTDGTGKHILKLLTAPFAKLFGWKFWLKKHEKLAKKISVNDIDNVVCYSGCYREKDIVPREIFNDYVLLDFEDVKLPSIANYDYYLTSLYGDYMTPPPPEKRVAKHDLKIYKK